MTYNLQVPENCCILDLQVVDLEPAPTVHKSAFAEFWHFLRFFIYTVETLKNRAMSKHTKLQSFIVWFHCLCDHGTMYMEN